MLLSIVMMVKNEEKNLYRTLKAIKLLMQKIDCELIILDTGSEDNTVSISKEFTDKIYLADWNKNFSDMRNMSISYAKGKWILILDADEEIIKYDKLLEFFNSDNHKKYNSASIELLNFHRVDDEKFTIGKIPRLFRNTEGFRYEGRIHEQPKYELPMYNSILTCKHYGYIYEDEEFRQSKHKRNLELLKNQLLEQPKNPYIHFQLAKQYLWDSKIYDALENIETSYNIYKENNHIPIYIYESMADIYLKSNKNIECEKLCLEYIKKDQKNIDIYYSLAMTQKNIGKYEDSVRNFKKYLNLIDNYDGTTQAKDILSSCNHFNSKNSAYINIVKISYTLSKFDEVIKYFDKIEDSKNLKDIYKELIISLYRTNRFDEILDYYNKTNNSKYEKNLFKESIEQTINFIKEDDKNYIFMLLSNFEGNYGKLNKLRYEKNILSNEYIHILNEEKLNFYYADIIHYSIKQDIDLMSILKNIDYTSIIGFISYLIKTRKETIVYLYKYLNELPNSFDVKNIKVYVGISEVLLGQNFDETKYKKLFDIYITYKYIYLKKIYNIEFNDYELLENFGSLQDRFVIELKLAESTEGDLEYIKYMKKLLIYYPSYKKIIKILIKDFEKGLNESKELKILKNSYKENIKEKINNNNLDEAKYMLAEYNKMFKDDSDILNMEAIIEMLSGNLTKADILFKHSFILNKNNFDTIFNIAYIKALSKDNKEAINCYKYILNNYTDEELLNLAREEIKKYGTSI